MRTWTVVVAVMMALAVASAVAAQNAGPAGPAGAHQGFRNRLGLTADQLQQIMEIRKQLMIDIKGVREGSLPRPEKAAKVRELVATASEATMNVLTSEQKDKITQGAIALRLLSLPRMGGGGFFAWLGTLDLTEAQKAQIAEIMKDTAAKVKVVREDSALTPQQKMEKIRDIRKAGMDRILSVLTPAQQEKAKAAMEKMRQGAPGAGRQFRNRAGAGAAGTSPTGGRRLQRRQGAQAGSSAAAKPARNGADQLDVDALLN
jgi:Spy/CpxP family protein refolding chaperone